MTDPTPEEDNRENIERLITRESVIESLSKDPPDPTLLNFYIESRQNQIQAPYVSREDTERMTYDLTLELAEIYRDANLTREAGEAYIDWASLGYPRGSWDEKKIWAIELPTSEMNAENLLWHLDIPYWTSDDGKEFVVTAKDLVNKAPNSTKEWDRMMRADLSFPIDIIYYRGRWVILDGVHRFIKAYIQGEKKVSVRVFPEERLSEIMEPEM
ncbi:MAG: hypothetical protein JWN37_712 [Candidatus Nomurabacteria bacterium]|nr:hypothetical protein [Candidatus Nomurabacteria bacterium]